MNLFDLAAKITLDSSEYEKGLNDASGKASGFGDKLKTAAKVGAAAIGAAGAAISKMVGESVKAYADYEQLVGGVETLFKTSADVVQGYAENAYQTAGLSANEYMQTVTSFSAALISSLDGDTKRAAELANVAITDMSDNANKMGVDIERLQSAYSGFARGNFTMLDNLSLGYAGTKEGMQKLLDDATALKAEQGELANYSIDSYADMVEAIHVVQTEWGITGTTAKEANETISGSLSAMQSAWQNLIVGIADENADFDSLISNFVDSASTAFGNILPRISKALNGIGKLVEGIAPIIVDALPDLISDVLPSLLSSAASMVKNFANGILENLPLILSTALDMLLTLARGISANLSQMIPAIVGVVLQIVDTLTDPATLGNLIEAAVSIIVALANGIITALPRLAAQVPLIVKNITKVISENLDMVIRSALDIIMALFDGLVLAIPDLLDAVPILISALIENLIVNAARLSEAAIELILRLTRFLVDPNNLLNLIKIALDLVLAIGQGIIQAIPQLLPVVIDLISAFVDYLFGRFKDITRAGTRIIEFFRDGINQKIEDAKNWGKDLIQNFIDGITAKWQALKDKVSNVAQTVKNFLGFSEPKEGPLSNFHTYAPDMMELFAEGIAKNEKLITRQLNKSFDFSDALTFSDPYVINSKGTGSNQGYTVNGGITLNVYGSEGQSVRELADEVMSRIQYLTEQKRAVFA